VFITGLLQVLQFIACCQVGTSGVIHQAAVSFVHCPFRVVLLKKNKGSHLATLLHTLSADHHFCSCRFFRNFTSCRNPSETKKLTTAPIAAKTPVLKTS
jgi:hypothetical protein